MSKVKHLTFHAKHQLQRLKDLEAGQSSEEKQVWQEAVNKTKPAICILGQGTSNDRETSLPKIISLTH